MWVTSKVRDARNDIDEMGTSTAAGNVGWQAPAPLRLAGLHVCLSAGPCASLHVCHACLTCELNQPRVYFLRLACEKRCEGLGSSASSSLDLRSIWSDRNDRRSQGGEAQEGPSVRGRGQHCKIAQSHLFMGSRGTYEVTYPCCLQQGISIARRSLRGFGAPEHTACTHISTVASMQHVRQLHHQCTINASCHHRGQLL